MLTPNASTAQITQKASGMNASRIFSGKKHLFPRHVKQFANLLNDRLQINIFGPKIMFPVQGFRCMSQYRLNKIAVSQNPFIPLFGSEQQVKVVFVHARHRIPKSIKMEILTGKGVLCKIGTTGKGTYYMLSRNRLTKGS